jgi:hypothetical protein
VNAIDMTQKSWAQISIESEARRICDERDIRDIEGYAKVCAWLRHRKFMCAIEPYMKLKCRIANMRLLDRIVMNSDGSIDRVEYKPLLPETEKTLEQIDEMIATEAARWGFNAPPTPSRTSL